MKITPMRILVIIVFSSFFIFMRLHPASPLQDNLLANVVFIILFFGALIIVGTRLDKIENKQNPQNPK